MLPSFSIDLQVITSFMMVLMRVGAIIACIPVLGSGNSPMRAKVLLSVFFSLAIYPIVKGSITTVTLLPISVGIAITKEILFGAALGLVARLIFTAVEMGGTIISYQMGFAAANVFDPANNRQVPLMSQFQGTIALMLFLVTNCHHVFFRALVESFNIVPLGNPSFSGDLAPYLMKLSSHMFSIGVQLSAPVLVVLLLSGLVLGIMARVFPQLNVFLLSFPLNIGLALTVIGLTLSLGSAVLLREFHALGNRFLEIIHIIGTT